MIHLSLQVGTIITPTTKTATQIQITVSSQVPLLQGDGPPKGRNLLQIGIILIKLHII